MQSNLFVILSFISLFVLSGAVTTMPTNQYGPIPTTFCEPVNYFDVTLLGTDVLPVGSTAGLAGGFPFTLTDNLLSQVGALWYNTPVNLYNGFVAIFTLSFDPDQTCQNTTVNGAQTQRCGGEGIAFIIQQDGPDAIGGCGSGMGYSGINNVVAIEFDTMYDTQTNDPSNTIERHISIIIKKGAADANEVNSIALNLQPLNFKNDASENYISSPTVRVEYLNNNLRIFIDDVLQLAYYNPLNLINNVFQTTNPLFYIGFTASTGSNLAQKHLVEYWEVLTIQSDADHSSAVIVTPAASIIAGQNFDVQVTIRDECGNFFYTDNVTNLLPSGFGDFNQTCQVVAVKSIITTSLPNTQANFLVTFNCTLTGENFVDIKWFEDGSQSFRDVESQPTSVTINPAPLASASLIWTDFGYLIASEGQSPTTNADTPLRFTVTPTDAFGNVVGVGQSFLSSITVTWPDHTTNSAKVTGPVNNGNRLTFTVNVDMAGTYTISSPWFKTEFTFFVQPGVVSATSSIAFLGDANGNKFSSTSIQAGSTNVYIYLVLRDSASNLIPVNITDIDNQVDAYGVDWNKRVLNNSYVVLNDSWGNTTILQNNTIVNISGVGVAQYSATPYRAGSNTFQVWVRGVLVPFQPNTITVTPGNFCSTCPDAWQYVEVWPWNIQTNAYYSPSTPESIIIYRKGLFKALVIATDIYFNPIYATTPYTLTLAGELMYPITMCSSSYNGMGSAHTICATTGREVDNYNSLVQRSNYSLYVNDSSGNVIRVVQVYLVSFADDSECGNGPWIPQNTVIYNWYIDGRTYVRCTASFSDTLNSIGVGVALMNSEHKRTNRWFVQTQNIRLNTSLTNKTREQFIVRTTCWTGVYVVYYITQTPQYNGTGRDIQIVIDKTEIYGPTGLGLWPDDPVQYAIIHSASSRRLLGSDFAAQDFTTSTSVDFIIYPDYPLYGYIIDAKGNQITNSIINPFGNFTAGYTVDNILAFNITIYDIFGNPSWYEAPNWFRVQSNLTQVQFQNTFNAYVLAPQCNPTQTIGFYTCTMKAIVAGYYVITSPIFLPQYTGLSFSQYEIYIAPGVPTVANSYAEIDLTKQTYFLATQFVNFYITPRDQYLNLLPPAQTIYDGWFSLLYQLPNNVSYVATGVVPVTDATTGIRILFVAQVNVSGITFFRPTLSGAALGCTYCSVTVEPNLPVWNASQLQILLNGVWTSFNPNVPLQLDNYNKIPNFYLQITDIAGNLIGQIPAGWQNFQANLNHPRFQNFVLNGLPYQNGVQFTLDQLYVQNYSLIVWSNQWNLSFNAWDANQNKTVSILVNNVTTLGQGQGNDSIYDSGPIDASQSTISPCTVTVVAGTIGSFNVETMTSIGKLSKSFYSDGIAGNIEIPNNETFQSYAMSRGTEYGTYTVSFNITVAGTYTFSVQILDGQNKMSFIPQVVTITVTPSSVYMIDFQNRTGLVLNETYFYTMTVDDTIIFTLLAYDFWGNQISSAQPKALGISFVSASNKNANFSFTVTKALGPGFVVQLSPRTVGNYFYTHFDLTTTSGYLNLTLPITVGNPSPTDSVAEVLVNTISPANNAWIYLTPTDDYENPVPPSVVNERFGSNNFFAWITYPGSAGATVNLGAGDYDTTNPNASQFYWIAPNLTQAGDYTFTVFFRDPCNQTKYTSRIVTVEATEASFFSMNLSVKNPQTQAWTLVPRVNNPSQTAVAPTPIQWNSVYKPTFQMDLLDVYGNQITIVPSDWNLTLSLVNLNDSNAPAIYFCYDGYITFYFCASNQSQQPEFGTDPNILWIELVTTDNYQIQLSNGQDIYLANWTFVPNPSSDGASDNPLAIINTVISPQTTYTTTAGQPFTFNVELRATDNLRANIYLPNPSDNITLTFAQGNDGTSITYQVTQGQLLGQFVITVTPYKTYPSTAPNQITFLFNEQMYTGFQPSLVSNPAQPSDVFVIGFNGTQNSQIGSATVDNVFTFTIEAVDIYGNIVPLTTTSAASVKVVDPNGQAVSVTPSVLQSTYITASFQPRIAGTYIINVDQRHNYTAVFTNGIPSSGASTFTVRNQKQAAGSENQLIATIFDQFGNKVPLNENIVQNFTGFFNLQNSLERYVILGPVYIGNTVVYSVTLNISGIYEFSFAYQDKEAICSSCSVIVNPGAVSFATSLFQYYSSESSSFITFNPKSPEVEDNMNTLPLYRVALQDIFGNSITSTPQGYTINATLTGGDNATVSFNTTVNADGTLTFNLPVTSITVGEEYYPDVADYWAGLLYSTNYYTLTFTDGTNTYNQSIVIKGDGNNDLDASDLDFSIVNTVISTNSLVTTANQYVSFTIETRTIDNKRKANFDNAVINVTFTYSDPSDNYTVIPSDLGGVYVVSVITNIAYNASANQTITFSINGSTYATPISLVVNPGPLYFAVVTEAINGTLATINATTEISFTVIGTDYYGNAISGISADYISLQVYRDNAPANLAKPIFTFSQKSSSVVYNIDARYAGEYYIVSPMFKDPMEYLYQITPAKGSALNSFLSISYGSDLPLSANVSIELVVTVYDQYNNVLLGSEVDFGSFNFTLVGGSTGTSYVCSPSTEPNWNFVNCTIYPTVADNYALTATIYGIVIPGSAVAIKITPGPIEISKTTFFKDVSAGLSVAVSNYSVAYGTTGFQLEARFRDYWGNPIQQLDPNDSFNAQLFGNNMNTITLIETINTNSSIIFSTSDSDAAWFERLVNATNYTILLVYSNDGIEHGNATLPFTITGIPDGSGNGNYDLYFTAVEPFTINTVAGYLASFTIELRTTQDIRYNGPIAEDAVVVSSVDGDNSAISFNTKFTGTNGRWVCSLNSTKSYSLGDQKFLSITVAGQTIQNIQPQLVVVPDFPQQFNLISTNYTGTALPENIPATITFTLFDEYGNQYTDSSIASQITPYSSTGNIDFSPITQSGSNFGDFNINFVPYFPPLVTEIDILLAVPGSSSTQNSIKSVLGSPFIFNVTSSIDPSSTDIVGTSWLGIPVDQGMSFTVLVRNQKLYCYPGDANVSVIFLGPYASYTVNDKQTSSSQFFNVSATVTVVSLANATVMGSNPFTAQTCTKYYSIYVPGGSLQKAGIYQMQVSVNQWTPIVVRQTVMTAGQISVQNTAALIPTGYGNPAYGKTPISIVAAETFSFQIQLYDKFDNIITYDNGIVPANFSFNDSTITSLNYNVSVQNNRNGSYSVVVNVTEEGVFNQFLFTVNGFLVNTSNMYATGKLNNFPNYIEVTPGYCTNVYPIQPIFNQYNGTILVGVPNSFFLQCADKFNNLINITKPEAQFSVVAIGSNLDTVGSDTLYPTVTAISGGLYEVVFTVAWSGNYTFRIQLLQAPYLTVSYLANYSLCPTNLPYFCDNVTATNKSGCTTGPLECTFPGITFSGNPSNPFVCANGSDVNALQLCPCPSGQVQSPVTLLCTTPALAPSYFPDVADITCPTHYVTCGDGSCRSSAANCPSVRTCAPGYSLCPDLQCAETPNECTAVFTTCPPAGNTVNVFKCWDQSCATSINNCPTRVTCSTPGQVFCEGKCVDNALQCQLPTQCTGTNSLRCSDGSCANQTSDCPSTKTCPANLALCEDGSCSVDCTSSQILIRRRMLDSNSGVTNYSQYVCPSGDVVPTTYNCPSTHVCSGANPMKCPDGSCVNDLSQCSNINCPSGTVACWDGSCQTSLQLCSTRTTCPDDFPILCPDGSCMSSANDCTEYVECPDFFPYRCGSGECRLRSQDCSTLITCPPEMPIKCQDQSCVRSKVHCNASAAITCSSGSYRCPDGTCASSKSLCPTLPTCPAGQIRCWDNTCQNDTSLCPVVVNDTLVCPTSAPIRCLDGSCRGNTSDCPTSVICPTEMPVLCDDGNCRESSDSCYPNSGCTDGTKRCPDGSCILQTGTCGTPITCPASTPYKCFDMTCKVNPADCSSYDACPDDSPIRCGDGTCVVARIYCQSLSVCSADMPVRCPDMITCATSSDQCPVISSCPAGFVECNDGSCSVSQLTCPIQSCPIHLSYQCLDGFCVADPQYCSDPTTGCPYDATFKCPDGSCQASQNDCGPTPNCNGGQTLCPDGSCSQSCVGLNQVGCSIGQIKCTNGECIDPTATECPVASCPTETPAKCLDGQCVASLSNCPSTITQEDFAYCSGDTLGNFVPCADGTCVASAEQCRPILPCQALFVRCNDGSCRPTLAQCPQANTCPSSRSYRCPSGVCAPSVNLCPSETDGCPGIYGRRCTKTGQCISNKTEDVLSTLNITRSSLLDPSVCNVTNCSFCDNVTDDQIQQAKFGLADPSYLNCTVTEDLCTIVYTYTNLSNGCNFLNPFLCSDGTCVSSLSDCGIPNNCPAGQYLCYDNTCATSPDICKNKSYDCSNNATYPFQCPDNKCAMDPTDCLTKDGCPVATPYKCLSDGNCYSAPVAKDGESGCSPTIQCPAYEPFVCSDQQCVGDSGFCQVETPCPAGQVRCNDRSCANSTSQCNQQSCPPKRPILCSSGSCVEKAIECQQVSSLCSDPTPYRCAVGVCVSAPAQCDMFTVANNASPSRRRILARLLQDNTTSNNTDPGCTPSAPYKCYDGSCRTVQQNCPILPACSDPSSPYRCVDGSCAASKQSCTVQSAVCMSGLQLCTDGICRQAGSCPAYDGCPLETPLQCGNGFCASSLAECAGHSDCPAFTPFRCANNLCVSDMSQCNISVRSYTAEDMAITISPITTLTFNFIAEPGTTVTHASIVIPSGSLLPPVNSASDNNITTVIQNSILEIRPVAQSLLQGLVNQIDETRIDYTSSVFPLSDANLSFYQTVRSTVFSINATNRSDDLPYRFPMYLTIDYEPVSADTTDYCLGQADLTTGTWVCLRSNSVSNGSTTYTFNLTTDGIYAVIFNPERRDAALIAAIPTWWDQHKGQFFLWGSVTLISLAIFSYVFWRMMRYVAKYRGSKRTMKNFEAQIKELQTQSTDILGQSLRDKVEGIVFVVNPMHEKHEKPDLSADIKEMEKALSKLEERDKQLEADNESLLNRNNLLQKELSKLKEQFSQQ